MPHLPPATVQLLLALSLAATLAGCSEPGTANDAEGPTRKPPAKTIDTEPVRREAVNRTVNVSGTLAAENEVTVSAHRPRASSARYSRGPRQSASGRTRCSWSSIARSSKIQTSNQQKAALARSLARATVRTRARPSARTIEQTPDVKRAGSRAESGEARVRPGDRAQQTPARIATGARRRGRERSAPSRRSLRLGAAEREEHGPPTSTRPTPPSGSPNGNCGTPASGHRSTGLAQERNGLARRAREGADAGDEGSCASIP